jgi:peptidoglycan L-alanyl-D-glutamate endopeptidase CwlK
MKLGTSSLGNLIGVYSPLGAVVHLAITFVSNYDFTVYEGVRSLHKQRSYYNRGVSKTMNSQHLYGRAVDLVPLIDDSVSWDGKLNNGKFSDVKQRNTDDAFDEIFDAMTKASKILNVDVENLYKKVGWDKPHWQVIGVDYDVRKLKHNLGMIPSK